MRQDVLKTVMRKFMDEYPGYISFCWHGGEPLLAGKKFFREVVRVQREFRKEGQEVENRLQTNGTLIDREWAEFFKDNGFKIGVSIDGPKSINDKQRLFASGDGAFTRIMNGIDALRRTGITFSVLATITSESVGHPEEIYRFVIEQKFNAIKLNPCFGTSDLSVDLVEYAHFMNRVFDLWFADDREDISFGHLNDIINGLLGGKPRICHMRNSCYRHVKIDYNGDVLPCDSFLGRDLNFGNIVTQGICEIVNSSNYRDFFNESRRILDECAQCKWLRFCNGGCSRYTFDGEMEKGPNKMCAAKKIMFEHISQALGSIVRI